MFDNLKCEKALPLTPELEGKQVNWKEEVFQTKDLDNLLDLYEIKENGKLLHLKKEYEWKEDKTSRLGGYMESTSERWEEVPFHGVISFYTSYCDDISYAHDLVPRKKEMTWEEIFQIKGNDYWIEFLAIFDNGVCREIKLEKVEKTPISARVAAQKEWELRREMKEKEILQRITKALRKIPGYRTLMRTLYRTEQKIHEKVSKSLLKLS